MLFGLDKLLVVLIGLTSTPVPCGDTIAASVRGDARVALCREVMARSNEVGTVPAGHEQRDRARGQ